MIFVSRHRHEAELAAVRSYNDVLRERCETAMRNEAAERGARQTITRQNAELEATNRRLEGRNLELGNRISKLTESDPEYAAQLERRIDRLRTVGNRILAAYGTEKKRADQTAALIDLDDRKAINEWEARVKKHDAWKPPASPEALEKRPVDGASGRPTHPAVELRRALERCRKLQALLDGRGKRVAS